VEKALGERACKSVRHIQRNQMTMMTIPGVGVLRWDLPSPLYSLQVLLPPASSPRLELGLVETEGVETPLNVGLIRRPARWSQLIVLQPN
jgi:hypothetical protein